MFHSCPPEVQTYTHLYRFRLGMQLLDVLAREQPAIVIPRGASDTCRPDAARLESSAQNAEAARPEQIAPIQGRAAGGLPTSSSGLAPGLGRNF